MHNGEIGFLGDPDITSASIPILGACINFLYRDRRFLQDLAGSCRMHFICTGSNLMLRIFASRSRISWQIPRMVAPTSGIVLKYVLRAMTFCSQDLNPQLFCHVSYTTPFCISHYRWTRACSRVTVRTIQVIRLNIAVGIYERLQMGHVPLRFGCPWCSTSETSQGLLGI